MTGSSRSIRRRPSVSRERAQRPARHGARRRASQARRGQDRHAATAARRDAPLVRELLSRQGRNEEQFRNYEVGLAQVRAAVDQHRHEVAQTSQARAMEDGRVRQQLTELDARIEETGKPIRSIQAHVAEVVETLRARPRRHARRAAPLRRTAHRHRARRGHCGAQQRRQPGAA